MKSGRRWRSWVYRPDDVRWVVLTHLHTDHAGGLHHFPKSEILVARTEYAATAGFGGQVSGYLRNRWPSWFAPRLLDFPDNFTDGFRSLPLTQAGDVRLVSTPGHTVGHLSVIVDEGDRIGLSGGGYIVHRAIHARSGRGWCLAGSE